MNKPKFRAWDESDKKMIEWEHLINYCDIGYLFGGYDGGFGKEGPKSYEYPIPMQYTGLKDKNGVEIYRDDEIEGEYPNGKHFKGVVEYATDRAAYVVKTTNSWCPSPLEICKDCVVVGNIHENPELLNEVE